MKLVVLMAENFARLRSYLKEIAPKMAKKYPCLKNSKLAPLRVFEAISGTDVADYFPEEKCRLSQRRLCNSS